MTFVSSSYASSCILAFKMKILILLFCILNGASLYPMNNPQVNIFENFPRNDTSPQDIDINDILLKYVEDNPISRSHDDETTMDIDPMEVISRQRRSSSSHTSETSNCKYVDFYVDLGDLFSPSKLNIGACVGGPLVLTDMGGSLYFQLLNEKYKPKTGKKNTAEHHLLQFTQEKDKHLNANDTLSYDIVPSCKVTLKSADLLLFEKNPDTQSIMSARQVKVQNLVIDSCT